MKIHRAILGGFALLVLIIASLQNAAAQSVPGTPPAGSTFAQRLAQRKQERNVQLSSQDNLRIKNGCVAAQAKLRDLESQASSLSDNRQKLYTHIDGKLTVIIGQLKLADQDTATLDNQRVQLAGKAAAFHTTILNYKQTLDDSVAIGCQADPVGFEALLLTARLYYQQLGTQSADIHDYVTNTLKATLSDAGTKLQAKTGGL